MSKKRRKRLEVLWEDSTGWQDGWQDLDAVMKQRDRVYCLSIGFVLADDKRGLVLAGSLHANQVAGIEMIPKGQVLRKRRLRT